MEKKECCEGCFDSKPVEGEAFCIYPHCDCHKGEGLSVPRRMEMQLAEDALNPTTDASDEGWEKKTQRVKMLYRPVIDLDVVPPVRIEADYEEADKALDVLLSQAISQERTRIREVVEGMKRTDDTQMNDDHVWDEALDAVLNAISKED